jgi:hypothetical protein
LKIIQKSFNNPSKILDISFKINYNYKNKKGLEMNKLIKKFEEKKYEMAKEFIKKGKVSKGLRYLAEDIFLLWQKGLNKKEILEILNQELETDIKFKTFESFFARHIKNFAVSSPLINESYKIGANAPKGKKISPDSSKTPKKDINNNKGAKAPDTNQVKGGKNESSIKKRVDVEEIMNGNIGDELFNKYNKF